MAGRMLVLGVVLEVAPLAMEKCAPLCALGLHLVRCWHCTAWSTSGGHNLQKIKTSEFPKTKKTLTTQSDST